MQQRIYTYLIHLLGMLALVAFMAIGAEVRAEPTQEAQLAEADALNGQVVTLYKQGKYTESIQLAERALAMREHVLGKDHPDVAASLSNLAVLYQAQGQYAKAEPLYQRSLAIREQVFGKTHQDVATSLNNLAALYQAQSQYDKAEPLYQRVLTITEQVSGKNHPDVANILNSQVFNLFQQRKYAEALPLAKRALAIREHVLDPKHPDVALSLFNLAAQYNGLAQYYKAEPLYQRALAIREQVLGKDHPDVATSLNELAALYQVQGQYAKAEPLFQRSLAIREQVLGKNHPDVASILNSQVFNFYQQRKYADALPLAKRALAIREQVLDPKHPDVVLSLFNLAAQYNGLAQYYKAEPLYQRALAIQEQVLNKDHPDVASSLNNLAGLYDLQGQYAKAEPLYQRSLAIHERALGNDHPVVAIDLNNLASLYKTQGQYAKAEPLYQRSLAILEQALGKDHPDVALSLNNLALLYQAQGQYAKAEPLLQRSLAIREQVLGKDRPDVAQSLHNLALLYHAQGQYAKAEPLYQRSLAIYEQALGKDHPDVAFSLNDLAVFYDDQGQYSLALDHIRRASRIFHDRILDNSRTATSGGDSERGSFKNTFTWHLGIAAAQLAEVPAMREELTTETFAIGQLFHDGPVGTALAKMAARFAGGNTKLANLARDKEDTQIAWQKADADLITARGKPDQDPTLIENLRTQAQELQTKLTGLNERLAKEFPDYAELTIPRPVTLEQTQKLLKAGEALVAYALSAGKSWVWLITPTSASFRQIDRTAEDIDKQVKTLRVTLSPDPDDNVGLQQPFPVATAHALYQDILAPEAAHLTGVKTLFVAADGTLESLPFAVLVTATPTGDPMDYKHIAWLSRTIATATLPTVSSLRALRTLNTTGTAAAQPFIGFGNPDFGTDDNGTTRSGKKRRGKTGTTKNRTTVTMAVTRGAMADPTELRKLQPLPETADELRAIAKTLGAGPKSVILGKKATVPAVTTSPLAQYRVVDFATHALVAGDIEKLQLGGQVEPAIVLTPPQVATVDNDGLLRASQVAQLKLNADWVILSACNTAAPDGTPGAVGLSGLAKAFFYAGAKAMLVSHWSVASKPAVALTTNMFKIWQGQPELGRAEALRQAEMAVLDNPDEEYFAHPGAWAPFIVAGEGGGAATTLALLDSNATAASTTPTIAVDFAMLQQRTVFSKPTSIQEGDTLGSGDGYFFHIQTGDGPQNYLYVYQIDSAGKVFRLFPNKKYRTATNPISAHKRITLPKEGEEFFLDSTTGTEDFYFIASTTPLPALEKLERGTLADITNQGLKSRGTTGIRTKTATVAAPTGETKSTVQEFIFADNLVHSFSIKHE